MYNLLVVDDEYEIRNGFCKFFPWEAIGFKVVGQAENGLQALDFIAENDVDVILCDIIMPVMTGLQLAEKLHEINSRIQIIFLSGYRDFEYAQGALEYGVRSYILKSANYNELIHTFSRIKTELDSEQSSNITFTAPKTGEEDHESLLCFNEKIISIIKNYIDLHYQNVTLEDLTNQVHMNPDYISKFFKQNTNQNFSDYLTEVRMKKAAALLDDVFLKVYEISSLVGYSNSFSFTRAFKNYYGMSPRDYRNRKGSA